jgi:hypothetical protein
LNANFVLLSIEAYIKLQQATFIREELEEDMRREVDPYNLLQPSTTHRLFDISKHL